MNTLHKHSDTIFIGAMSTVLLIGALYFMTDWQSIRRGWNESIFAQTSIDLNNVASTGMNPDEGITPIDNPLFTDVAMARSVVTDTAPVIVLDYYNEPRAYPLTIMMLHEIVNDVVDDVPLAITFCPLCNSAIIYERTVEGDVLRMGVSGNIYGNNFLMYDDATHSWWSQLTGEALVGDYTGEMLTLVPSQVVGFQTFAERYPEGQVLIGDANRPNINYNLNPYLDYFDESASPMLVRGEYDQRLPAMTRILGADVDNTAIAYPFETLREQRVINDSLGDTPVVIFWKPGIMTFATPITPNLNAEDSEIGQAALFGRTVDDQTLTFRYHNGHIIDAQTGSEWNIFGEAISGDLAGTQLPEYTFVSYFWFAWAAAYPTTDVYQP